MNLITILAAVVIAGSAVIGLNRRFGNEFGSLVYQLASLLIVACSIWIGWDTSQALMRRLSSYQFEHWPIFAKKIVVAWHNNPNIGTWIAFLICYLIFSALLHRLMRFVVHFLLMLVPGTLKNNQVLGGLLGVVAGGLRVVFYGAALFLVVQYLSVPFLAKLTQSSFVYQTLDKMLYRPYLQPLVSRDLPVLASNAFPSLSRSINLFAIPSGLPGEEQGVLLVPQKIVNLSHALTDHVAGNRQKAYILYEWEIHHISYDWHKYNDYVLYGKWDEQTPLETLQTGKGVCADYALLYADLAHASGLTVKIVEGTGGIGVQKGSHAWNAVLDNKQGNFLNVDTTWGSEQDNWFGVPDSDFSKTHFPQNTILIQGGMD